ncbi:MAG TPA: c-type cytochrome [Candidatus Aquilonibacter sp.]|nr:c-type cytochrome [Candidatus Aquilonibacter sp.]
MLRGFILGIIVTLAAAALIGYIGVTQGLLIPANADAKPGKLETWAARQSLHATLRREAPKADNPLALNDKNLLDGIKLYGDNCIVCHGAADGKPSTIAAGLYQNAPQLGKDGVEDDPDGVTYWKLYHGIRLTGMPAFGPALSQDQLWALTLFLKHMDKLPPVADSAWKKLKNPAPPAPADEHQKKGGQ